MGLTIVSGLAKGVDAQAHWGALEAGGRTLAVLGSGLDWRYPKENARLYREIPERGALISEFPPDVKPHPSNFPRRNRVIAGLSLAVVVVEAGERSGALITARQGLEMNREVMALPGPAGLTGARGGHQLIKNGAALVESMSEVLTEIRPRLLEGLAEQRPPYSPLEAPPLADLIDEEHPERKRTPQKLRSDAGPSSQVPLDKVPPPEAGSPEEKLLHLLADGPKDVDSLVRASGLSVSEISLILLSLELSGHLVKLESGCYQSPNWGNTPPGLR